MEKINFNQMRGFSDSITLTFNFVKQEFKPLLKTFAVIVLPLIFLDMFAKSFILRDTLALLVNPTQVTTFSENLTLNLVNYGSTAIMYFWMSLVVISYIRVYQDQFAEPFEKKITPGEVWTVMWQYFGKMILWGLLYLVLSLFGAIFCLIPGIYIGVVLAFGSYFIVLQNNSIYSSTSNSMNLVRGHWWNFFGYLLLLQLIVAGLGYVFSIPTIGFTVRALLTEQTPGIYEMTFAMLFASLGQNFLQIISIVGIGVRFYSYLEERDHTGLLSKIEQLGESEQQIPEREEIH